ncbi:MAG: XRE family transcriptional regulator [Anaerolineales bacterium]|jgi:DNA-binding Xre family transcriptional regulator|nr:XRE family transcriptional regulator [Chloroflexota bacterium]MBK6644657.1 XRE family transcriptional regulator [Anaerolineales bacterium]
MNKKHVGSDFDDFLKEDGIYEQVQAVAIKRVIAYQIAKEMKEKKLSKTEMASRMKTSRAALERLLDPENASITLITLERAASAVGKKLKVQLA